MPSQRSPSAEGPIISVMRVRISRAALLVKVTASSSHGLARPVVSRWASRVVSTRVLPVPAPASTRTGPSVASTAARCSGFSPPSASGARTRARSEMEGSGEIHGEHMEHGGAVRHGRGYAPVSPRARMNGTIRHSTGLPSNWCLSAPATCRNQLITNTQIST